MTPTGNPVPNTLFLFIDESGNFDFTNKGTAHFVMAGVAALAPLDSAAAMHALRYQLLADGKDVSGFHATEDRQVVRDEVFKTIGQLTNIQAHAIYGEKRRAAPTLQKPEALHALFGAAIVKFAIKAYAGSAYQKVVVVFDQALTKKGQSAFHATVKPQLKALGKPFHLYFQRMEADANGQIADYVAWSKFVQLERGEQRPWSSLQATVHPSDFNIFRNGNRYYY